MTVYNARIEPAPAPAAGGIRAQIYSRRLGLKAIVIGKVDDLAIDAVALLLAPDAGEPVTILLPTGSELRGMVSRVEGMAFRVQLETGD
jgi:hypothetical protein